MQLQPGVNISESASKRLVRAEKLFEELRDDVLRWVESAPITIQRLRQDNGRRQRIVAEMHSKPDFGHWETLYSDLLSNTQAARDALFHDLLKLPGVTAPKVRHYFPGARTQDQWARFADRYSELPELLLERIKRIQPFMDRSSDGSEDPQYIETSASHAFREANNHSKHRGILPVGILFEVHTWNSPLYPVSADDVGLEELDWIIISENSPRITTLSTVRHQNPAILDSLSFRVCGSVGIFRAKREEADQPVWDQLLRNAAIAYTQAVADIEIVCKGTDDPDKSVTAVDYLDYAYNIIAEISSRE